MPVKRVWAENRRSGLPADGATTRLSWYGIGEEIYLVSRSGVIWCVQSPGLGVTSDRPVRCSALPVTVRLLGERDIPCLGVPEAYLE